MGTITIGADKGERIQLSRDVRETHLHVIGGTGSGKSRFLEHMIRRDIRLGHGVCVIDPHGSLYHSTVDWLTRCRYYDTRTVHLLDLASEEWTVGFNPLCSGDGAAGVRAAGMVDACVRVWDRKSFTDTPRLAKLLYLVLYALAEHRLSLFDSGFLTNLTEETVRRRLTENIANQHVAMEWREINDALSPRQFTDYFDSTKSRLLPFLSSEPLQRIMGQTEDVIDLGQCMNKGDIFLVNLETRGQVRGSDARVLGAMLFSDLFISALRRDISQEIRPFYCYVDECADFLTDDIARMLDQTRKYGLHLILAHQRLGQLMEQSPNIYDGVMESARSKVVFRVDGENSAEVLGRHLFRTRFDLTETVVTDTRPTVTNYVVRELRGYGMSESEVESQSHSTGEGTSSVLGQTESLATHQMFNADGELLDAYSQTLGGGHSNVSGSTSSVASGQGSARGRARSETVSEALEPQIEWLPVRERKSLEEHMHEAIVAVRSLPNRQAFVYLSDAQAPISLYTPEVERPRVLGSHRKRAVERFAIASPYTKRTKEVQAAILERRSLFSALPPAEEENEDYFRHRDE